MFQDEHHVAQRSHRRPRRRDERMLTEMRLPRPPQSSYEPPVMERWDSVGGNQYQSNRHSGGMYTDDRDYGRSWQRHTHVHRAGGGVRSLTEQQNPAQDLAADELCPHGFLCFQCVRTQELAIMENFGAFESILGPGLHVMCWPYSTISVFLSLRIQQLDLVCETKSRDDGENHSGRLFVFTFRALVLIGNCCVFVALENVHEDGTDTISPDESARRFLKSSLCPYSCRRTVPSHPLHGVFCSLSIGRSRSTDSGVCVRCCPVHCAPADNR